MLFFYFLLKIPKIFTSLKSSINYKSQDARMVALESIQVSISAVGMWIHSINSLANEYVDTKNVLDEDLFLKSVGSNLNIQQTEEIMFKQLSIGFTTLVHFKIDNLFNNILNHLQKLPKQKGYWHLTDKILDICDLPKKGLEKNALTAFANIRNSLHANGIHRNQDLSILINGINFDFVKDKMVECAGWKHIVILIELNVDILEKILLSKNVINIKTEITDNFAKYAL